MVDNQRAKVSEIIPLRKLSGGETTQAPRKKITPDDLLEDLQQQLEIAKIAKIGESMGAFNFGGGRQPPASGEAGIEQLAKAANMFGIDVTKITELRQREVDALRSELDKERRAALEQRLSVIDNTVTKMTETMQAFMKNQQEQRAQVQPAGLFGMADQVTDNSLTKLMIARLIDMDGQRKEQRDPVDELFDRLTLGDRLKERLGLKEEPRHGVDPNLMNMGKLEIVNALLQDDRERERMKQESRLNEMKLEKLGGVFKMIQDYMPDVLEAIKTRGNSSEPPASRPSAAAHIPPERTKRGPEQPASAEAPSPEDLIFEEIACPHPGCGKRQPFPVNIPEGYGINCAYCKQLILKAQEQPPEQKPAAEVSMRLQKPAAPAKPDASKAKEGEVQSGEQLRNTAGSVEDNEARR